MLTRRTLKGLFAILLIVPLGGCAAGLGNYGPGAPLGIQRRGERHDSWVSRGNDGRLYRYYASWWEDSAWHGALDLGLAVGQDKVSLTGMRDSTIERSRYLHMDAVFNMPGDAWSLGGSVGYLRTPFPGSPVEFSYSGITAGPMAFVGVTPWMSVSGTALRVFGSVKDENGYYFTPRYGFLDEKQPLAGWRYEAAVNVIPFRSSAFDCGFRVGYQSTSTEKKDVYTVQRQYKSSGPFVELLGFGF